MFGAEGKRKQVCSICGEVLQADSEILQRCRFIVDKLGLAVEKEMNA